MAKTIDLTGDDDIPPNKQSIDIDSDAEGDEELKLAIALSLQDQHTHLDATSKAQDVSNNVELLKVIATSRAGFMGLDRRAMEAERLARLKRKRGSDGEPQVSASNAGQALSPSSRALSPPPLRGQRLSPVPPAISYTRNLSTTKKPQSSSESNPFSFSEARVLLTSHPSRHTSSGLSGVSLRDLTAPPVPNLKLKSTLLSSFIADFDWLLPHFDTRLTSFVFVLHAETPQHRQLLQQDFAGVRNVRLVMPKCVGDMGKLHSKVMLLFFKSETVTGADDQADELCRLVIPSANLTPTDWGVGGVMENILFVVDLPTKQPGRGMFTGAKNETQFESDLKRQLQAMEVPEDVLRKLDIFDFTATRKIGFVHSMSQSQALRTPTPSSSQQSDKQNFFTTAANSLSSALTTDTTTDTQGGPAALSDPARTGLLSLSDTITSLGLSISSKDSSWPPKLDFIASSLGNLTLPFVRQLYSAVCGTLDPSTIAPTTSTRSKKTKSTTTSGYADTLDDETIKSNLRIYFPTSETVRNSKGGPMCGGTICFQKGWWETNELIRECLYDCVGNRGDGVLMHSKVRGVFVWLPFTFVTQFVISTLLVAFVSCVACRIKRLLSHPVVTLDCLPAFSHITTHLRA